VAGLPIVNAPPGIATILYSSVEPGMVSITGAGEDSGCADVSSRDKENSMDSHRHIIGKIWVLNVRITR
jgi:hypothetical protein